MTYSMCNSAFEIIGEEKREYIRVKGKYHIAGKFHQFTLFKHLVKTVWWINRLTIRLLIVNIILDDLQIMDDLPNFPTIQHMPQCSVILLTHNWFVLINKNKQDMGSLSLPSISNWLKTAAAGHPCQIEDHLHSVVIRPLSGLHKDLKQSLQIQIISVISKLYLCPYRPIAHVVQTHCSCCLL